MSDIHDAQHVKLLYAKMENESKGRKKEETTQTQRINEDLSRRTQTGNALAHHLIVVYLIMM